MQLLSFFLSSRRFLIFTRYSISQHRLCLSLSLYFDLSLSLFLLALNIFDNHFWITKRLWICALFRFVRCISIWGSKLAYNCLHSLADIPKMCKKSLQKKKTMRIEDECICVKEMCYQSYTHVQNVNLKLVSSLNGLDAVSMCMRAVSRARELLLPIFEKLLLSRKQWT